MKFEKSTFLLHGVILSHVLVAVSMKCNGLECLCLKSGLDVDEASEGAPTDNGSDRSNLAAGISDNFVHSNLDSKGSITDVRRDRDLPPKKRLFYRNEYAPTFDGIHKPNFDLISDKPTSSTTNPINSVVRCSNSAKDSPLHGLGDEKSGRDNDLIISVEKSDWDDQNIQLYGKRRTTRHDRDRDLPPKKRIFYRNEYASTTFDGIPKPNIVQTFDLISDRPPSSTTNQINSVLRYSSNYAGNNLFHGLGDEKSGRDHETIISVEKSDWDDQNIQTSGKRTTTKIALGRSKGAYEESSDDWNRKSQGAKTKVSDLSFDGKSDNKIYDKTHRKENYIWNLRVSKTEPINESPGLQSLDLSSQYA
ncbi:hypothetical protein NEOLI_003842, partial [Neolecta irregularis DAH-3]